MAITDSVEAQPAGGGMARRVAVVGSTGLFAAMFTVSGALFLIGPTEVVTSFHHLGYPDYFRLLLGVAKLLGVAALVLPLAGATLREWAYAGFTFTCIAAAASHALSGDALGKVFSPLFALGLLMVSYLLRAPRAGNR